MLIADGGGSSVSVSSVSSTPAQPPSASEVAAATSALRKQLGNAQPDNIAALQAAIQRAEQANAALSRAALARAAILIQAQDNQAARRPVDSKVDPIAEAESQVGLTHVFDQPTLDAAAKSLTGSPLVTDATSTAKPVSVADARTAIESNLNGGMTMQEAVNAARVQFGGGAQNETPLDEAALSILGDQSMGDAPADLGNSNGAPPSGNPLTSAAQQLTALNIFTTPVQQAAVHALSATVTPTAGFKAAAHTAEGDYQQWQKDKAAHASAAQLAQDEAAYHQALSSELNAAAGETGGGWAGDVLNIDRRWQAEQVVLTTNTASGVSGAPSVADLRTSLQASAIVDSAQSAGSGGAASSVKAAQSLTQSLQGVPANSPIYSEVMGDARTQTMQSNALQSIVSAHGNDPTSTLVAEGKALSAYRGTVFYPALLKSTLAAPATRNTIGQIGVPGNLSDIASLLQTLSAVSPDLAAALFSQRLQGKVESLIAQGDPNAYASMSETTQQMDDYYGPLGNIVKALGGPDSQAAKPVVQAMQTQFNQLQQTITREQQADPGMVTTYPFMTLGYARDDGASLSVYQSMIDAAPNSALAKTLEGPSGLKPDPAPVKTAPADAQQLSTAMTALAGKPLNAQTLAASRKANPAISDETWAQAALITQANDDGSAWATKNAAAIQAGTATPPSDLIAQASGELANDQLFDADTLNAATTALQTGTVAGVANAPASQASAQPGASATSYMSQLVGEGMTLHEAIIVTRAWMGGGTAKTDDYLLAQAALTVQGQQELPKYYDSPDDQHDPIALASSVVAQTGTIDPAQLTRATADMTQSGKPDDKALNAAITQAESDYARWQKGDASALTDYHNDLTAALNAAAGHAPGDSGWQTDPAQVDQLWKAQYTVEMTALAPQIQAAAGTGQNSPQSAQLNAAFTQWQNSLGAQQIIQQTLSAQQANGGGSAGNVAAAQALTAQIGGMPTTSPVYNEVMNDGSITALSTTALQSITQAAAPPMVCTANDSAESDTHARLAAAGKMLGEYQHTVFYGTLVDETAKDPTVQQLFKQIAGEVNGQSSAQDKLNALSTIMGGVNPDLNRVLFHQEFAGSGKSDEVVQWVQQANDLNAVSNIYAAAGGSANSDMTRLRHDLEAVLKQPLDDGGIGSASRSSSLNEHMELTGRFTTEEGQDLGFGNVKSQLDSYDQLAQDIIDDPVSKDGGPGPSAAVVQEVERETGYQQSGTTPAPLNVPVATKPGGKTTPAELTAAASKPKLTAQAAQTDATLDPNTTSVTADGNIAGLPWLDGMQVMTSYDAVLNAVGAAQNNGKPVTYAPGTLAQEQALSEGQFAEYNPNQVVYNEGGTKTTLGDITNQLIHGEGVGAPSGDAPVTVASLSVNWAQNRDGSGKQLQLAVMEGINAQGNQIDVGPADTTVRNGYSDWQSNTGFAKGVMSAMPHLVFGGDGNVLTGNSYWSTYKPDTHWYDNFWSDAQIVLSVGAGLLVTLVQPETAGLFLVVASEFADAYLATTALVGTVDSLHTLAENHWSGAGNWVGLTANVFGGMAGAGSIASRAATMFERVAASSDAFADASNLSRLPFGTSMRQLSVARAAANDTRPIAKFADSPGWLRNALTGSDDAQAGTRAFVDRVLGVQGRALSMAEQGSLLRRLASLRVVNGAAFAYHSVGAAAMLANLGSMGFQVRQLANSHGQASAQDWANFASSAGLMGLGFGVARVNKANELDAQRQQEARNQPASDGETDDASALDASSNAHAVDPFARPDVLRVNQQDFDFSNIEDDAHPAVRLDAALPSPADERAAVLNQVARITMPGGAVRVEQPASVLDETEPRAAIEATLQAFTDSGFTNPEAQFVAANDSTVDLTDPTVDLTALDRKGGRVRYMAEAPQRNGNAAASPETETATPPQVARASSTTAAPVATTTGDTAETAAPAEATVILSASTQATTGETTEATTTDESAIAPLKAQPGAVLAEDDPAPDAPQRAAAPPMRSYMIPEETQADPAALATVMSRVLRSGGRIEQATYVVFASHFDDPAQHGLPASAQGKLLDDLNAGNALELTRYDSMFDAYNIANRKETAAYGIAIVDSSAMREDGSVPPEAVIATIRPGQSVGLRQIDVNAGYAQPISFAYPRQGRASTQPSVEIDEATGGWLVPEEVGENGGMLDALISALLNGGGRLAGTRYVVYRAMSSVDPTHALDDEAGEGETFDDLDALAHATNSSQEEESNDGNAAGDDQAGHTVAIVDDEEQVVATLRRDPAANGWSASFNRDYAGRVSVAYPEGFEAGKPLIRSEGGARIDAINAQTGDGRTQLASYPRREADLAMYNFGAGYPENRLLGENEAGKANALLLPAPPGYFVVDQHVNPAGFIDRAERPLSPEDEAALIIGAGWDGAAPILFYSCGPGAQIDEGGGQPMEAPVIQRVTDALQRLYPLMRGQPVDAGFHTVAANSPVAWYVPDDDARVGGYTSDVRVASKQDWNEAPELSSWREQQDSIVGSDGLRFSRFYPSLPLVGAAVDATVERVDVVSMTRSESGDAVTLTLSDGHTLDAQLVGMKQGAKPARVADILMPGEARGSQPFELLRDPQTGGWVIIRRVMGGSGTGDDVADPAANRGYGAADGERLAQARDALREARISADDYRLLLDAAKGQLGSVIPSRSDFVGILNDLVEGVLRNEARATEAAPSNPRARQEGSGVGHDLAVREVINQAILVARSAQTEDALETVAPIEVNERALDYIVGLRTANARNSRSLILRDADHYLSNLTQEWQIPLERPTTRGEGPRNPSVRLAKLSGLVTRTYDLKKTWLPRRAADPVGPANASVDLSQVEPRRIAAAAPGGRRWAALGTRDFMRLAQDAGPRDTFSLVTGVPEPTDVSAASGAALLVDGVTFSDDTASGGHTLTDVGALLRLATSAANVDDLSAIVGEVHIVDEPSSFSVTEDGARVLKLNGDVVNADRATSLTEALHELAHAKRHARMSGLYGDGYTDDPGLNERVAMRYARIAAKVYLGRLDGLDEAALARSLQHDPQYDAALGEAGRTAHEHAADEGNSRQWFNKNKKSKKSKNTIDPNRLSAEFAAQEKRSSHTFVKTAALPDENAARGKTLRQQMVRSAKATRKAAARAERIPMFRLSDLNFDVAKELTLDTAGGPKVKPAGEDRYVERTIDPATGGTSFRFVDVDASGLPKGYSAVNEKGVRATGADVHGPDWSKSQSKHAAAVTIRKRGGVSISEAIRGGKLEQAYSKPPGFWTGYIMTGTDDTFGPRDGLYLVKKLWDSADPADTGVQRARTAVATSQIYRAIYGEGAAADLQLVYWEDPSGDRRYGTMTPFVKVEVSTRHARSALSDPEASRENGVFATAAGHIALRNSAVVGNEAVQGDRQTFGNIGLLSGGRSDPAAYFMDLDSAMGVDPKGKVGTFEPVRNVKRELDAFRKSPETLNVYGPMENADFWRSVDVLNERMTHGDLENQIKEILGKCGHGTKAHRQAQANLLIDNIRTIIAFREKQAPFDETPYDPSALPVRYASGAEHVIGGRKTNPVSRSYQRNLTTGRERGNPFARMTLAVSEFGRRPQLLTPEDFPDPSTLEPRAPIKLPKQTDLTKKAAPQAQSSGSSQPARPEPPKLRRGFKNLKFVLSKEPLKTGLRARMDDGAAMTIDETNAWLKHHVLGTRQRLYAYAQDGVGPALGYIQRRNGTTTWYRVSDRTRAQTVRTRAKTAGYIATAGGAATVGFTVFRHITQVSPMSSGMRYFVNALKLGKDFREHAWDQIQKGHFYNATRFINLRYRVLRADMEAFGVPAATIEDVENHTRTLLGLVENARSAHTDDDTAKVLVKNALDNYVDRVKQETGFSLGTMTRLNPRTHLGATFRWGIIGTWGVSFGLQAAKIASATPQGIVEAALNMTGFAGSITEGSYDTVNARAPGLPQEPGSRIKQWMTRVKHLSATSFISASVLDAVTRLMAAHPSMGSVAYDVAYSGLSIAISSYASVARRLEDRIYVFRSPTNGKPTKLVGYVSYAPDGGLYWHRSDGQGGFESRVRKETDDLATRANGGMFKDKDIFVVSREKEDKMTGDVLAKARNVRWTRRAARRGTLRLRDAEMAKKRASVHSGKGNKAAVGLTLTLLLAGVNISNVVRTLLTSSSTPLPPKKKHPGTSGAGLAPGRVSSSTPSNKAGPGHQTNPIPTPKPTWKVVVVKHGDTLWGIAADNGDTLQQLEAPNPEFDWALLDGNPFTPQHGAHGRDPDLIYAGDDINVPIG